MMPKLNKVLLTTFIICFLALPAMSKQENISAYDMLKNLNNIETNDDKSIETKNKIDDPILSETDTNTNDEQLSKKSVLSEDSVSLKKTIKKFLYAMLGVTISSLLLFLGLTIYNRIRVKIAMPFKISDDKSVLSSPANLDDAVRTFLDVTKWV
ncbi:hypothetical protein IJO12_03825 [bacterium]|nr:hypothetical protein [bacterium]